MAKVLGTAGATGVLYDRHINFYQKLKATTVSFQTLPTEKLKSYLPPQAFIKGTAGFVVVEMACLKFTEHPWCSVANKQFY